MTRKWKYLLQSDNLRLKIKPIDEFKLGLKGLIKPKKNTSFTLVVINISVAS